MLDYVKCCNCDFIGGVSQSTDLCPKCNSKGNLSFNNESNDDLVEYIEGTPIYKDVDFRNLYAKFSDWLREVNEKVVSTLSEDELEDLYDDFENWCEEYDITPHKI